MASFLWLLGVLAALWLLGELLARHFHGVVLLLTNSQRAASIAYDVLVLPGVVLHEISHVLVALLLGIRVVSINLFQFRRHNDPRQGEVVIEHADPLRLSIVGAAPLFGGITALLLLVRWLDPPASGLSLEALAQVRPLLSGWRAAIGLYLLVAIANTMFPSEADRRAWWVVGVAITLMALLLWLFGVQPTLPPAWLNTLQTQTDRIITALLPVALIDGVCLVVIVVLKTVLERLRGRRIVYRSTRL